MKLILTLTILLGFYNSFADGFTDDLYTMCEDTKVKKDSTESIEINGTQFMKIELKPLELQNAGTSVFLGKDVELANFLLDEVLTSCQGLKPGVGMQIGGLNNPYSELFDKYKSDKQVLKTKALEILIQVNDSSSAKAILRQADQH